MSEVRSKTIRNGRLEVAGVVSHKKVGFQG